MQSRLHYVTLVLLFSAFITFYFNFLLTFPVNPNPSTPKTNLKEIVSYSLLKKIEIESEQLTCTKFNRPKKVNFQKSEMWTKVPRTNLHVFNVYYDDRLKPFRYLRLIGMMKGTTNRTLYCQMKMEDKITITKAVKSEIWLKEWDEGDEETFNPVLISCYLPSSYIPQTLSINSDQCTLNPQTFKVIVPHVQKTEDNYTMTICVKPLNFLSDISVRLMQWIEISKVLGADPSQMSSSVKNKRQLRRNGTTSRTVNHDEVFNRKIWQKRRNEVITYNDCMYRNLRSSHFVIPLDIDEVIIPRIFYTWKEALRHIFKETPPLHESFASFSVRNAYFLEEFGRTASTNIFFFDYTKRSQFSDEGDVFNHYSLEPLKPGIRRTFFLPENFLQKNHYKPTCSIALLPECIKYTTSQIEMDDILINKYKTDFFKNYGKVYEMFTNKSE
ncbi:hypothetical protein RI129_010440 [Pyrocoelia pectoralis]|uniref:Glycosyltransferase family 92 protein n=1 Tax=Pyrocoelia pectoralis TaxID=417401 RepID=A0AAN7V7Z6_9COLE